MATINAWIIIEGKTARVVPDPIRVPFGRTCRIVWTIHKPGNWRFHRNGIKIPGGKGIFSGHSGSGTTTFSVVDKNTKRIGGRGHFTLLGYKYEVHLRRPKMARGKWKMDLDPAIENENC